MDITYATIAPRIRTATWTVPGTTTQRFLCETQAACGHWEATVAPLHMADYRAKYASKFVSDQDCPKCAKAAAKAAKKGAK